MTDTCGCCEGTQLLTPQPVANRPGLDALAYRVGTHAAFLETMKARLSSFEFETQAVDCEGKDRPQLPPAPLAGLTTRAADDPAIALLDAWATVADVLTFYQERIANEGYLRTASERRSILEMARLVGYALRPGVASTAYLAYTVDENTKDPVIIPRGARVTSVPGPGETPQSFETVEEIEARAAWNLLKPRIARPQSANSITNRSPAIAGPHVYLRGINTNLKPNDPLLIDFGGEKPTFVHVQSVQADAAADRTLVTFQETLVTITPSLTGEGGIIIPGTPQVMSSGSNFKFTVRLEDSQVGLQATTEPSCTLTETVSGDKREVTFTFSNVKVDYAFRVVLQPTTASPIIPETRNLDAERQIGKIIDRYLGAQAGKVDGTATFARVSKYLKTMLQSEDDQEFRADPTAYITAVLSDLETERQDAEDKGWSNLQAWLEGLISELGEVILAAPAIGANRPVRDAVSAERLKTATGMMKSPAPSVSVDLLKRLTAPPSRPPANALRLGRNLVDSFVGPGDTPLQIVQALHPTLRDTLPSALASAPVTDANKIKVFAPRITAPLFGNNAQKRQRLIHIPATDTTPGQTETEVVGEWPILRCDQYGGGRLIRSNNVQGFDAMVQELNNDPPTVHDLLRRSIGDWYGRSLPDDCIVSWDKDDRLGSIIDGWYCYNLGLTQGGHEEAILSVDCVSRRATENPETVYLDATYDKILPGSWVVVDSSGVHNEGAQVRPTNPGKAVITQVTTAQAGLGRAEYGMSGKTTEVGLLESWIKFLNRCDPCHEIPDEQRLADLDFQVIRSTLVYAQFEELPLAEEPVEGPICSTDAVIELDGLYEGLQPGRWLIISGERTDTYSSTGVKDSELLMLKDVTHDVIPPGADEDGLAGDKTHTYLTLSEPLGFCYKRDTVTIHGNVVKATHGETRQEVLGSGDGSKAFQSFTLKQAPLTYVAAPTPTGAESTLHVRVNGVEWHEAGSLAGLTPTDRSFTTRTDDDSKTTVVFGDGRQGARPPTGAENIKTVYRTGIGQAGNVRPGQISQLVTRPLGLKAVINPQRASGGADRESRDQARRNAPLGVMALDRLVSTQDYADFARTFAGIGKASAVRLSDGRSQLVHVTVAGANDIPIDTTSDLYANLVKALHIQGDPHQAIQVDVRELVLIVLSANVCILPDYQWESVVPMVRARLLDAFGFERRELGQDVLLSEIISTIQAVEGVAYVDVDKLRGVPEKDPDGQLLTPEAISISVLQPIPDPKNNKMTLPEPLSRLAVNMAGVTKDVIRPAQLAYLTPDVEATLILNEVKA